MNDAHWHLVVNHLPIIFPLVGVIILVTGFISKSEAVKRTAFMIFIVGAMASIVAMSTGEGAEEVVEKISGVTKKFIHEHEEFAETFSILSYALGAMSLIGLWASFQRKKFSNTLAIIILVFAFVVLFFGKETGTTGGEIRHTEIRSIETNSAVDYNNSEKNDND